MLTAFPPFLTEVHLVHDCHDLNLTNLSLKNKTFAENIK